MRGDWLGARAEIMRLCMQMFVFRRCAPSHHCSKVFHTTSQSINGAGRGSKVSERGGQGWEKYTDPSRSQTRPTDSPCGFPDRHKVLKVKISFIQINLKIMHPYLSLSAEDISLSEARSP